jgi:hypothetical protein
VLLGGLGGVVVAQSDDEGYAYVTGTQTYIEDVTEPTEVQVGDVVQIRRANATYAIEMSDPLVTGTMTTLGIELDVHPDDRYALEGLVRLSNADGAWTGTETGAYDPTMGWQFVGWLDGMAAYEGLTFFVHGASPDLGDGVWELEGVIFEGDARPVP